MEKPFFEMFFGEEGVALTTIMKRLEKQYIMEALRRSGNNKTVASQLLGINRTTLIEKMRKHQMPLNAPGKKKEAVV